MNFKFHEEEIPFGENIEKCVHCFNRKFFSNKITRFFVLKNIGNLPMRINKISIQNSGCSGFGFHILNCQGFLVSPKEEYILKISFIPEYSHKFTKKKLFLFADNNQV